MNGIAAIFNRNGAPVDVSAVEPMISRLAHRGPDAHRSNAAGQAALGQCSGWTTPQDAFDDVPLQHDDTVLVADLRLDNREELIAGLGLRDERLGDAAILLHAYLEWGVDCATHLLGDFAFAIWDGRRRALFCARDQLGVRPLVYHLTADRVVVASEIKAILAAPGVRREVDHDSVRCLLAVAELDDATATLFKGVRRLPAAHCMLVDADSMRTWRYWSPSPRGVEGRSDGDCADGLAEVLGQAVRARLRSALPVASMLSGGLDSSSVTCTALGFLMAQGQGLDTYSARFEATPASDEGPFIAAIAAMPGIRAHSVFPERSSPLAPWPALAPVDDEPAWSSQVHVSRAVYDAARDRGHRVVLTGLGGDWTISLGLFRMAELLAAGRVFRLWREVHALHRRAGIGRAHLLRSFAVTPLVPASLRRVARATRRDRRGIWVEEWKRRPPLPGNATEAHLADVLTATAEQAVELEGRIAAACGVELRHPMLDRRVIEYCLGLPSDQKFRDGWTRFCLHQAMRGAMPEMVRTRGSKGNLAPAMAARLRAGDLASIRLTLGSAFPAPLDQVDRVEVTRAIDRFAQGDDAEAFRVWIVALAARWLGHPGGGVEGPSL